MYYIPPNVIGLKTIACHFHVDFLYPFQNNLLLPVTRAECIIVLDLNLLSMTWLSLFTYLNLPLLKKSTLVHHSLDLVNKMLRIRSSLYVAFIYRHSED